MDKSDVRILLVDDDEDDYLLTRELLADIPDVRFQLDWVSDPDKALETMCRNEHDLFLLDYHLGRTNGLSLLREAMKLGSSIPMILLTGQGERAIDLGAMQAGAVDFLEKGRLDSAARKVHSLHFARQETRRRAGTQSTGTNRGTGSCQPGPASRGRRANTR